MEKLKVLIADDELGMRKGTAKVLDKYLVALPGMEEPVGFDISEASNGLIAKEMLETDHFDLILLDYKMPELSGLEVLDCIRDSQIDILTIMITAYASLEVAVSATKNGAFDFLAKPFSPEELKSVVEKASRHLVAHRQAKRLSEEKRKVRFQFISVLAHELKSPLAAVDSYLQLLKKHVAGEELSKYDHIVERSLVRLDGMRRMILDLLDLTRIESGQKKRELTQIEISAIALKAIETYKVIAHERNIDISLHSETPVHFYADAGEMEIIFNNLISNAVKYNRDKGRVDIYISTDDKHLYLSVSDTGIGMTPEEKEKLFGEFVRIKNEDTHKILGSGLGLSIMKKIVSFYNGKIDVESQRNVGTVFKVVLTRLTEDENK
ncbi:MAG: hybrid sensor histidine kinase/response regulator [Calditrichaceae bacterium]|nr:hybrid sensor histidine kinase/response regulator [Calditrichaceae bacterium]MBN2708663.1 hybrid sensor histidine kinase/response regulator [Calditrichaceae bacterium]RQV96750.1 MAG: hybrid sensor histidine kinase/response regulator [Calditrichota bacterium]